MNRIYMDNAATTRMKPEVLEAMMPYLTDRYGNPSSIHEEGRRARQAIDKARQQVADALLIDPECVLFTSGSTESNNIIGNMFRGCSAACPLGEHPSLWKSVFFMSGCNTWLHVDRNGFICGYDTLDDNIPSLVAFSVANNEVGTIQPSGDWLKEMIFSYQPHIHMDITQIIGHAPFCRYPYFSATKGEDVEFSNNSLTLSAHKFGGPKGVGVLAINIPPWDNLMVGGNQERGLRPGTENVAGIVGLGKAIELATKNVEETAEYTRRLAKKLATGILSDIESTWLNGPKIGPNRLPGNVNISFAGCRGDAIVLALDEAGVAVSSGSACSSGSHKPSRVLMEMYNDEPRALSSVRFTLNEDNTEEEVDYVLSVLPKIIGDLRE